MSKTAITLYGREYLVSCDEGEERRLAEIVQLVESKMKTVADKAGNATESRLLMLTCLMLADQLLEIKRDTEEGQRQDEDLYVAAVDHLNQRIAHIASQVGRA